MNRESFMKKLMKYLKNIPAHEKHDVNIYYSEMFDEAGISNSDIVPESFGNSKNIALEVLADINTSDSSEQNKYNKNSILIIILALLSAPISVPIAITLGLVILSIVLTFFSIGVALIASFIGIFVSIFVSDVSLTTRILYLGIDMALLGSLILFVEFIIFLVRHISIFISKKVKERRINNEK